MDGPQRRTFRAFGMEISTAATLPGLVAADAAEPRPTRLDLADPADVEAAWPAAGAERRLVHRFADGEPMIVMDEHPEAGFRVWGHGVGTHLISADGREIRCAPLDAGDPKWPPFVIGQVLPLASLLQGFEVLHASAVAFGDRAVAFVGPSGTGKTSLALAMVQRGARFVTDDVLALEATPNGVVTYAGAALASVSSGGGAKETTAPPYEARSLPLAAVYLLPGADSEGPVEIEPLREPQRLLGNTFVGIITEPRRLERMLNLCGAIASDAVVRSVTGDGGDGASELAARVYADLAAQGLG